MSDLNFNKELKKLIKKYKPTRKQLENTLREVRRDPAIKEIIGPPQTRTPRKLPKMPSKKQIERLLDVMEEDGNLKFKLMVKLFLYTGLRNSEMVNLRIEDIDLDQNRIFVRQGKGSKDRYIPIFKEFRDTLLLYLSTIPHNRYLFENKFHDKYSDRYVRKVFQNYCQKANLPRIHPHKLRHFFITYLTKIGWTDEQIMLLSGHDSKSSLKIYQHIALPDVEEKYQQDMKGMEI